MLPSEVWANITEWLKEVLPQCEVRRQYAPTDDLTQLAEYERPTIWAALGGIECEDITTTANVLADTYTIGLTLLWKVRDVNNPAELDSKIDTLQQLTSRIRQRKIDTPAGRLYIGAPNITTVYDIDTLIAQSLLLSEVSLSVTNYSDRYYWDELDINGENNSTRPEERD